jgi:radical SAM superfamily enzyme YgiQ (UPF0313 family)
MVQQANVTDMVFAFLPAGNFLDVQFTKSLTNALGPAYIIAYLKQAGFDAEQAVSSQALNISECARLILDKKPKVVGFTVYFTNYNSSVLLARTLKGMDSNLIVVFGGPTPTVQSRTILESLDCVDICVRNEGEETTLQLLTSLRGTGYRTNPALLSKIDGISYKIGDGVYRNRERDVLFTNRRMADSLDTYPSPYLSGVLDDYEAGVLTARGCNQSCTYCNCAVLSKRCVLTHSIDRVVEELGCISRMSAASEDAVFIFDDAFTLIPNRAARICEKIIEGGIQLSLRCITRCDRVSRELLDLMKEAGFKSVGFALESATPGILRNIGKLQSPGTLRDDDHEKEKLFIEQFHDKVAYAQNIGLFTFASIMIGLPGETSQQGQQTVDLIESLDIPLYSHNILQIYPGTPLADDYERYGLGISMASNGIEYITRYAYDPLSVKLAPGSNIERAAIGEQKHDVRLLSLIPKEAPSGDYCNNCIYVGDDWPDDLTLWLEDNLSVNGRIIQIYSTLESLKERFHNDRQRFGNFLRRGLLTTAYSHYYRDLSEDGVPRLRSLLYYVWGERCDFPIYFLSSKTGSSLNEPDSHSLEYSHSVYLEADKADALSFSSLLRDLSDGERFSSFPDLPLLPYFAALCKWDTEVPNCVSLETLIVDSEGNIKTCWNGRPIGRVGMSFGRLRENLGRIRMEIEEERECMNCGAESNCAQCLFPDPLEGKEYCGLRRDSGMDEGVLRVRSLQVLSEWIG